MPTYNPSLTTGQTYHTSASLANTASATDDIDLTGSPGPFYFIRGQVSIAATTGSPSGNITIEVLHSPDGTNWDTEPSLRKIIPFSTTATKLAAFVVLFPVHTRVKVTNTVGESVTYVGRYAGVKQTSA